MKTKVEEIEMHYNTRRQAGHTMAVVHGAAAITNGTAIIVAHNEEMARHIRGIISREYEELCDYIKVISINSLNNLRGMTGPMLIDNAVFCTLAAEVRKLREEKEKLGEQIAAIKNIISDK